VHGHSYKTKNSRISSKEIWKTFEVNIDLLMTEPVKFCTDKC